MINATTFLPRIPQPVTQMQPVTAPPLPKVSSENTTNQKKQEESRETLLSWISSSVKTSIRALPKIWKTLAIQLAIVMAVNLIFWPLKTYSMPAGIAKVASLVIFLTATYNNIIPKTIYWVILFTFGKKLFHKIRKEGMRKAISPIKGILPEFKNAIKAIEKLSWSFLMIGGGTGLAVANNFASYSRFSGARNKMDKYFVAIVISFTVSYILGESKNNSMFKFLRLSIRDISRLLKKKVVYTDQHSFLILSGFVAGLLLDAPLILMKLKYGGYLLGAVALIAGIVLLILAKNRGNTKEQIG